METETAPSNSGSPAEHEQQPPLGEYREAFSAIDDIPGSELDGSPAPKPEAKPEPKPEAKPAPKPEAKPGEKPGPKPGEKPAKRKLGDDLDSVVGDPEPKPDPTEGKAKGEDGDAMFDGPTVPKQLREAYKKTREELEQVRGRTKELEAAAERAAADVSGKLHKEYQTKLEASERRRSELETEIRYLDYQRSQEFEEKYHGPLKQEWRSTMEDLEGMVINDGDKEREVTPQDVARLLTMNNVQARRACDELFGSAASVVMEHRAKLMQMTNARAKAIDEWKEKGSLRDAEVQKQRQAMRSKWESDIEGYQQEYPEMFGRVDGDDAGNRLIESGMGLARKAFLAEGVKDGLTPEQRREEVLEAQTMVALRAAAYPRVLRDLKTAKAQLKELQDKLAEYQVSEPEPGGKRGGESVGRGKEQTPEDAIDALPGMVG